MFKVSQLCGEQVVSDQEFYKRSLSVEVYPHLKMAFQFVDASLPKVAVDVGCGAGRDALYMVEQGYKVYAYDRSEAAILTLSENARTSLGNTLFPQVSTYEQYEYPTSSLICACFSLFFCNPKLFAIAWSNINRSLLSGGVFCGHFMGPNDSWVKIGGDLTIHSRIEVEDLFHDGFEIINIFEHNAEGAALLGTPKHWHTYSVIARKII